MYYNSFKVFYMKLQKYNNNKKQTINKYNYKYLSYSEREYYLNKLNFILNNHNDQKDKIDINSYIFLLKYNDIILNNEIKRVEDIVDKYDYLFKI